MKKILITGALGNIAPDIIDLLEKYYSLRLSHYREPQKELRHEFIKGDLRSKEETEKIVRGVNYIVHLAAKGAKDPLGINPEDAFSVNVGGVFHLLEAAIKFKIEKIVYTSSIWVYGLPGEETIAKYFPIDEEHPLLVKKSPYGLTKVLGEELARGYSRKYNLPIIILRPGLVINKDIRPDFGRQILEGKLKEDPQRNYFNHVDGRDVASAIKLSLESEIKGCEIFNISAEDHVLKIPTLELIQKYYPQVEIIYNKGGFLKDNSKSLFSIDKAKKLLGFKPRFRFSDYMELAENTYSFVEK